jgi:2-keto-4-pentenoate hydratase/2-oxohepta-3-ene-1,7-dioic acid hydratase in catechol pathway
VKLCRFNGDKLGLVQGTEVIDVSQVLSHLPAQRYPFPRHDLFIEALPALRSHIDALARSAGAELRHSLQTVKLDAPVPNAGKIVGAPINYKAHVAESKADAGIGHGRQITSISDWGMFLKANTSLIGMSQQIRLRFADRRNDHELELGVIIGKPCHKVSAADAMAHVAGYSVALDMTVRGPEFACFRKSVDTYAVLGPYLVTADDVADPNQLDMWLKVNGEIRQQSNTQNMVYDVAKLIEFTSAFYTLMPGDIIMTGTPEGVGPVQPGDLIEAHIAGVGDLSIRVAADYA